MGLGGPMGPWGPRGTQGSAGSATTRLRDGVPRAFCMPYSCLSDNLIPFSLDICLLDTSKDPPKPPAHDPLGSTAKDHPHYWPYFCQDKHFLYILLGPYWMPCSLHLASQNRPNI